MQGEILALFGVCIALGMSELLLPGEENGGARRMMRFLATLAVLLLILTPFTEFLQSNKGLFEGEVELEQGDIADYERILSQAVQEQSGKDMESGLLSLLEKEYGISRENCTVVLYFSPDGTPDRVCVFLSGAALFADPEELENDLEKRLGCTVEVR